MTNETQPEKRETLLSKSMPERLYVNASLMAYTHRDERRRSDDYAPYVKESVYDELLTAVRDFLAVDPEVDTQKWIEQHDKLKRLAGIETEK